MILKGMFANANECKLGEDTPRVWKKGKDPHPQDKIQHLDLTKDPGRFTTRPLPIHFTTKMSVVRPFSVLSKDEIGA